jgi:hypothetical protein
MLIGLSVGGAVVVTGLALGLGLGFGLAQPADPTPTMGAVIVR